MPAPRMAEGGRARSAPEGSSSSARRPRLSESTWAAESGCLRASSDRPRLTLASKDAPSPSTAPQSQAGASSQAAAGGQGAAEASASSAPAAKPTS